MHAAWIVLRNWGRIARIFTLMIDGPFAAAKRWSIQIHMLTCTSTEITPRYLLRLPLHRPLVGENTGYVKSGDQKSSHERTNPVDIIIHIFTFLSWSSARQS